MRRHLDKIRFRSHRRDEVVDAGESPTTSDAECYEDFVTKACLSVREEEEGREAEGEVLEDAQAAALQDYSRTDLNEVKGHLEIALLETHFLQEELQKLRDETNVDSLKQEVERERCRRTELERQLNEVLGSRAEATPPHAEATPPHAEATPPHAESTPPYSPTPPDTQTNSLSSSLQKWLYEGLAVYVEDFRFQPEETVVETEEPLSAKRLTENMRRLKRGAKPVRTFMRNLSALSRWRSFYTSAIAFFIYMYAAWSGWLIPVFLFLAVLRLSLNYLIARGWRIEWSIVPSVPEPVEPPKEELSVTEKFQLVLDVAQRAQNLFGRMSDILEKIKNLFIWVEPDLTRKLYVGLCVAFISSCLLPYKLLGFIIAVYAGIKFFIIDFLYKSCPKLRARFDTPYIIWTSLPTNLQLKERSSHGLSRRVASRGSMVARAPAGGSEDGGRAYSTRRGAFHEVFSLPETERPLAACENGWRCCLINRERKTPTDYLRNGFLYITENFLCFESSSSRSSASKKNKVISLMDVIDIQKYKVLSVLPGSGMGISITTPSTTKPLVFGAMVHRDEAFEAIFSQYLKAVAKAES
ncbi:GRAM domain-containing protein 4-like [Genypterus blacodes]|uniref:GRAM domain-containing protein 4-like n=1 Tax=Genypterus blacodes TaxID=154954 RepID=UPI003F76CCDB